MWAAMSQELSTGAEVDGPADASGGAADPSSAHERDQARMHPPGAVRTLRQAMRRARDEDAERVTVQTGQRLARLCRLEMMEEALRPLAAQIPADIDLFDIGLMPGATPRLFIDMIGFIEMGRDTRVYSFVQDTRHGRIQLAESADVGTIVEAVTDYVARRILERDKALASDAFMVPRREQGHRSRAGAPGRPASAGAAGPNRRRRRFGWFGVTFAFIIDLFGSIAFFTLLAGLGWLVWNRLHGQS